MEAEPRQESSWMDSVEKEVNPSAIDLAAGFVESRWQVALVAGIVTTAIVYFVGPPMVRDEDGKTSLAKSLFWGAVATGLTFAIPFGFGATVGEAAAFVAV